MKAPLKCLESILDLPVNAPVTIGLVYIVAAVVIVAVGIVIWLIWTFQTKTEAKDSEKRLQENLDKEIKAVTRQVEDLHQHLRATRSEIKEEFVTSWNQLNEVRTGTQQMSRDVAYIKGLLEPKPGRRGE